MTFRLRKRDGLCKIQRSEGLFTLAEVCLTKRWDRKAIKARNEARRLAQPLPPPSSNPVDIIANEVRTNRWHRRHSSIASAKVQSLLNVTSDNTARDEDEPNSFYYAETLEQRKRGSPNELRVGMSRENEKQQEESEATRETGMKDKEYKSMDNPLDDYTSRVSPLTLSLRSKRKGRKQNENGVVEEFKVAEKSKHRLESRNGIDNPAVHLKDESPYSYDSSEEWVRTDKGTLEMVNLANRDPFKHHYQLQNQEQSDHQRYIFHPARTSREDLTDISLFGKKKTARLAKFDSYDSSEFTSAHDLRTPRTNKPHQKPPRQHLHQQQKPQRSRGDLEHDYELIQLEKKRRHHDQGYQYNEEIDLSPRKLLSTMRTRNGNASNFSDDRHLSQRDRQRDIDLWLGAGRRNSYTSALDNNEVNLYFAAPRSFSVADLSSSNGVSHPRHGRVRNDSRFTRQYGRVNNAYSHSTDKGIFYEF
ncbi:hypothetical protein ElyMa_005188700 [Elysia marginata]|uniref:Uncharacterized protein n=1 Tax=Elysia marginata TaxID=1093978 RepID=A0AAV4JSC0_9GAST|nr:hypothetical protein ElyMa_005188700 [Elysia marginata]